MLVSPKQLSSYILTKKREKENILTKWCQSSSFSNLRKTICLIKNAKQIVLSWFSWLLWTVSLLKFFHRLLAQVKQLHFCMLKHLVLYLHTEAKRFHNKLICLYTEYDNIFSRESWNNLVKRGGANSCSHFCIYLLK